jgi:uncharacterized FlaG/YvyC family protein
MQVDKLSDIDQAQTNYIEKSQRVKETDKSDKVDPNEQYKNAKPNDIIEESNEIMLDNIQFGYNKKSRDFFIKVKRGDIENKYPTDEMMKLKAHLLEALEASSGQ